MDWHEIFTEGYQWADERTIKFGWKSGLGIWIEIRIASLIILID